MPVYVDGMKAKSPSLKGRQGRYVFSHLVADTLDELHEMATKLGVRKYFQEHASFPHYDITQSKKAQAIRLGAIEIDRNQLVRFMREYRAKENEAEPRLTRVIKMMDKDDEILYHVTPRRLGRMGRY